MFKWDVILVKVGRRSVVFASDPITIKEFANQWRYMSRVLFTVEKVPTLKVADIKGRPGLDILIPPGDPVSFE